MPFYLVWSSGRKNHRKTKNDAFNGILNQGAVFSREEETGVQKICHTPRILFSATGSGCGKTTVSAAILAALCQRGLHVQSMKSGPDYIDPMFHTRITGRIAYHADPFFSTAEQMRELAANVSENADLLWIEGAMGFYDGIGQTSDASTYTTAMALQAPTLLLLQPQGMGRSVAAVCKGFLELEQPNPIRGILLNRVRSGMYAYYREILERETGIPVYGYLPELPEVHLESRHLGLLLADEVTQLDEKIRLLGETAAQTIDLDGILALAAEAPSFSYPAAESKPSPSFRLGIAQDRAFCFYYAENLDLLQSFGAELVPFSPIHDTKLPDDLDGIYLGGGYPELHLKELSHNQSFLHDLRCHAASGIPIFAECGGFLYLQQELCDADGQAYPMAQLLDGTARMGKRLCRFGYVTLTAQQDTLLGPAGTQIRAHEFHYADSTENGDAFLVTRPNGKTWQAYQSYWNILGGFPHLYFPSNPKVPANFAVKCRQFREEKKRL